MSPILSKRERSMPQKFGGFVMNASSVENVNGDGGEVTRVTRGNKGKGPQQVPRKTAAPTAPKQAPRGSRMKEEKLEEKKTNKRRKNVISSDSSDSSDTDTDSDSDSSSINDPKMDLEDRVFDNSANLKFIAECSKQMFRALIKVLAHGKFHELAKIADESKGPHFNWLKDCVKEVISVRYSEKVKTDVIADKENNDNANIESGNIARAPTLTMEQDIKILIREETTAKVNERMEDIQRKKNIILIGIHENPNTDDMAYVREMFRQMERPHLCSQIEKQPTRLGTRIYNSSRPRALKVELSSPRAVNEIIDVKKYIMWTQDFFNVFINRDLSREDRKK